MRHAPLAALLLLSATLTGVEAKPEGKPEVKPAEAATTTTTPPASDKPAEPAATARPPDPTAAIVAEGRYVYRQRDIDALMLIAARHAKARFAKAEEDRVREVLVAALLAREPLMDALAALPSAFSAPEREALLLDLLDYQAEAAKAPPAPAPVDPATSAANTGATPANAGGAAAQPPTAPPAQGPLLVRLPPLNLTRTLPGTGKRHLSLTIALFFRDQAQAQKLQDRAPLVQDAILSHIQNLSPAQFVEPNQLTLKDGITAAIIAKVPDFPPDAVLIPEMEAGAGDGREAAKSAAP
jgi:flagellar basal body-associated protein FliL